MQKKARIRLVAAVSLAGIAGLVVLARLFFYPAPYNIVTLDSPDHRLRVVVQEQVPGGFMASPYEYRIALYDNQSGQELPGDAMCISNDSCTIEASQFQPEWNADSSEVKVGQFKTNIHAGRQNWTHQ